VFNTAIGYCMMEVVIVTCDDDSVSEVVEDETGFSSHSAVKLEVEDGTNKRVSRAY
jgi:hypothetical protein